MIHGLGQSPRPRCLVYDPSSRVEEVFAARYRPRGCFLSKMIRPTCLFGDNSHNCHGDHEFHVKTMQFHDFNELPWFSWWFHVRGCEIGEREWFHVSSITILMIWLPCPKPLYFLRFFKGGGGICRQVAAAGMPFEYNEVFRVPFLVKVAWYS